MKFVLSSALALIGVARAAKSAYLPSSAQFECCTQDKICPLRIPLMNYSTHRIVDIFDKNHSHTLQLKKSGKKTLITPNIPKLTPEELKKTCRSRVTPGKDYIYVNDICHTCYATAVAKHFVSTLIDSKSKTGKFFMPPSAHVVTDHSLVVVPANAQNDNNGIFCKTKKPLVNYFPRYNAADALHLECVAEDAGRGSQLGELKIAEDMIFDVPVCAIEGTVEVPVLDEQGKQTGKKSHPRTLFIVPVVNANDHTNVKLVQGIDVNGKIVLLLQQDAVDYVLKNRYINLNSQFKRDKVDFTSVSAIKFRMVPLNKFMTINHKKGVPGNLVDGNTPIEMLHSVINSLLASAKTLKAGSNPAEVDDEATETVEEEEETTVTGDD